jgi:hypothetical protein
MMVFVRLIGMALILIAPNITHAKCFLDARSAQPQCLCDVPTAPPGKTGVPKFRRCAEGEEPEDIILPPPGVEGGRPSELNG